MKVTLLLTAASWLLGWTLMMGGRMTVSVARELVIEP
jgi:hypothetical protein